MRIIVSLTLCLLAVTGYGQQEAGSISIQPQLAASTALQQPPAAASPTPHPFQKTLALLEKARKDVEKAKAANDQNEVEQAKNNLTRNLESTLHEWVGYLAGLDSFPVFLSEVERQRIDKQVGSGANASGSTSLVSRGSVPALFGLAVENGAVTQNTNGTTITFRANPAGIIKALLKQDYLTSGSNEIIRNPTGLQEVIRVREDDIWYRILNRASVAVSFDTSKGPNAGIFTAERSQLTGYSGHYDIINHRDPRDKNYWKQWTALRDREGRELAGKLTKFAEALNKITDYDKWLATTRDKLLGAEPDGVEDQLLQCAEDLRALVKKHPEVEAMIKSETLPALKNYAESRRGLLNQITKSFALAFDYSNTRQIVTLGNTDAGMVTLPAGVTNGLPDLGNFLLTASGHFIGTSEITGNASGTRFNGRRVGPKIGRWRDFRAGVQIDVPLKELKLGWEKPALTFSYLYLKLFEEPLGEMILVNGVAQSRKGNINFGQAKLEFPTGSSGVRIPISMTFSNRTELIKEKDVRGHIGITFDLDKLFSKPK